MPFQRILCAVDFSDGSRRALDAAVELASRLRGSLALMHVVHVRPELFAPPAGLMPLDPHARGWQAAHDELAAWCGVATAAGVPAAPVLVEGVPADAICEEVERGGHDLVVMGSHGRGALERAILGSVADRVVRRVGCPVLVVPPRVR